MKIVKSILASFAFLFAALTIIFSLGSLLCKYTDIPQHSMIQVFGYISFFWILAISAVSLLLFILLKRKNIALLYLGIVILFVFLLNDFSLNYLRKRDSGHRMAYDSIKVIAYNVKYYSYGIDKVSGFINQSGYDVVLLSESVLTSEKLEYLKKQLPSYSVLSDNGHDLCILSKYPVLNYKIVDLPTFVASLSGSNDIEKIEKNGVHRSFVHAVIDVNGTPVNVLSVRLLAGRPKDHSLSEGIKWGKYLLHAQDEELSAFTSYLGTLKGPFIFGGDLNVTPNTQVIHKLNQLAIDSYLETHMFGSYTFKISFPTMRLDYLFHSNDVISDESNVVKLNPVLSDHDPVSAQFLIPKRVLASQNK
jgi:endonuclease/exonuclease/phosphatase (EEP) superfamily protein YafD